MAGTILCADDDRHFCQILSRAFGQAGWRVELVHDGETALARIRELEPALVTLDVMLPRLDGFSVLELLRREPALQDTPVLLVSGCTFTSDYETRARGLAAAAVLKKPVPVDQLLALVQTHPRKDASRRSVAPSAASWAAPSRSCPSRRCCTTCTACARAACSRSRTARRRRADPAARRRTRRGALEPGERDARRAAGGERQDHARRAARVSAAREAR